MESNAVIPTLRVFFGISSTAAATSQNHPPFPRKVITFQNWVRAAILKCSCIHNNMLMSSCCNVIIKFTRLIISVFSYLMLLATAMIAAAVFTNSPGFLLAADSLHNPVISAWDVYISLLLPSETEDMLNNIVCWCLPEKVCSIAYRNTDTYRIYGIKAACPVKSI